jgi:DNA-binding transcriptional ArsR family regulator
MDGDIDLAPVGALLGDATRCRILTALLDGRALAASVLADEAGIARSTASEHLGLLADAGLLAVEQHGRHRYYRLAGPRIARLLESIAELSPAAPVRSLRGDTRARALRRARTCYNHLAGELGVGILDGLVHQGAIAGHDGSFRPEHERLSAPSPDVVYRLTDRGVALLGGLGLPGSLLDRHRGGLRHCVDWSEQRHHLSGPVGAALADRLLDLGWIRRGPVRRSILVTEAGERKLSILLGQAEGEGPDGAQEPGRSLGVEAVAAAGSRERVDGKSPATAG